MTATKSVFRYLAGGALVLSLLGLIMVLTTVGSFDTNTVGGLHQWFEAVAHPFVPPPPDIYRRRLYLSAPTLQAVDTELGWTHVVVQPQDNFFITGMASVTDHTYAMGYGMTVEQSVRSFWDQYHKSLRTDKTATETMRNLYRKNPEN